MGEACDLVGLVASSSVMLIAVCRGGALRVGAGWDRLSYGSWDREGWEGGLRHSGGQLEGCGPGLAQLGLW